MKSILVGVGKWGSNIAREALALDALVALVDASPDALARTHKALGSPSVVQTFAELDDALRAFADAVVIVATPPHAHYAVARRALEDGRDVWVEKPLCDRVEHARELVDLARERSAILFTDHLMQYNRAHCALLRVVRSGFVGKVTRVRATRVNF
eukprot:IDg15815t1